MHKIILILYFFQVFSVVSMDLYLSCYKDMYDEGEKMDSNLDELKKEAVVDNSNLEEIMKKEITPESQREFFEIFKESQLFMPVTYSANMFEGLENAKPGDVFEPQGLVGFNINYLSDNEGK